MLHLGSPLVSTVNNLPTSKVYLHPHTHHFPCFLDTDLLPNQGTGYVGRWVVGGCTEGAVASDISSGVFV